MLVDGSFAALEVMNTDSRLRSATYFYLLPLYQCPNSCRTDARSRRTSKQNIDASFLPQNVDFLKPGGGGHRKLTDRGDMAGIFVRARLIRIRVSMT